MVSYLKKGDKVKLITRETDYALRSLCFIAKRKEKIFSVTELTRELHVPRPFLRKILQVLNRRGMLKSLKGTGGGFILAKDSSGIFITDIMRIFQGKFSLNECFLNKLTCPRRNTCALRKKIVKIEDYVKKELSLISITSLLR